MAMNIHQEARRRQMHMDRVCEARKRMALCDDNAQQSVEASFNGQGASEPLSCTDQGQFYQTRVDLTPFRVNHEGHRNRYRNRQHMAPHCDQSYKVIYPGSDNLEYVRPPTRKNRRENSFIDNYEITKKVNGEFHMQVIAATTVDG